MSNSSRIEKATREYVGAVLTSEQISELVKQSDPSSNKGVYPGDAAGKRLEDGTLTFRGKMSYGDLVLELVGKNQYKVLATEAIVRLHKKAVVVPPPVPAPAAPAPAATTTFVEEPKKATPKKLKKTA